MGVNNNNKVDILADPAIGFVDESVPGVYGYPLDNNELKDILKPIRPPSIESLQTVKKTDKTKQECKSNCSCKKKEEEGDNNSYITDYDDDSNNEQLETDDSEEEEDEESDIETDDRDVMIVCK